MTTFITAKNAGEISDQAWENMVEREAEPIREIFAEKIDKAANQYQNSISVSFSAYGCQAPLNKVLQELFDLGYEVQCQEGIFKVRVKVSWN